jgi:cytochrome c biogenesis protein ResB
MNIALWLLILICIFSITVLGNILIQEIWFKDYKFPNVVNNSFAGDDLK